MTPEGKLKKEVDEYLTSIGAFFWKPVVTAYSARGVDYVGWHRSIGFAIETKIKPRKPTGTQLMFMDNVAKAGGFTCLAYSLDDVKEMIQAIDDELADRLSL